MEENEDESYLLLVENVITPEEKAEIVAEIDRGFTSSFDSKHEQIDVPAASSGLRFPVIVALSATILTAVLIFFFLNHYSIQSNDLANSNTGIVSESEWEILKKYKDETELEIKTKEIEINTYQARIEDYDRRLNSIKEIISFKREIEVVLSDEREKMLAEGYSTEEISDRIAEVEKSRIAGFGSDFIEDYGLSINQLNDRIDSILDEKTESVKKLNAVTEEREQMLEINEMLTVELGDAAMLEDKLTEVEDMNIKQEAFEGWVQKMFFNIFESIEAGYNDRSEELIESLLGILTDEFNPAHVFLNENSLSIQVQSLKYLKLYSENIATQVSHAVDDKYLNLAEGLKINLEGLSSSISDSEREIYEEKLRDLVFSIPELADSFNIILTIEQGKWTEENKKLLNKEPAIQPPEPIDTTEQNQNPELSTERMLLGRITDTQFNIIFIASESGRDVEKNTKFGVYKSESSDKEIASGVISNSDTDPLTGRIVSIKDTSQKPDSGDYVYLK